MRMHPAPVFLASLITLLPSVSLAAPASVSYSTAPSQIDAYDFAEITATVASPDTHDPFEDATLTGTLTTERQPSLGRRWLLRLHRRRHLPHPLHGPGRRLQVLRHLQARRFHKILNRNFPRRGSSQARPHCRRSPVPLALYLREPVSITSSTEPRRIGWWAGATTTPFNTASTASTGSRSIGCA